MPLSPDITVRWLRSYASAVRVPPLVATPTITASQIIQGAEIIARMVAWPTVSSGAVAVGAYLYGDALAQPTLDPMTITDGAAVVGSVVAQPTIMPSALSPWETLLSPGVVARPVVEPFLVTEWPEATTDDLVAQPTVTTCVLVATGPEGAASILYYADQTDTGVAVEDAVPVPPEPLYHAPSFVLIERSTVPETIYYAPSYFFVAADPVPDTMYHAPEHFVVSAPTPPDPLFWELPPPIFKSRMEEDGFQTLVDESGSGNDAWLGTGSVIDSYEPAWGASRLIFSDTNVVYWPRGTFDLGLTGKRTVIVQFTPSALTTNHDLFDYRDSTTPFWYLRLKSDGAIRAEGKDSAGAKHFDMNVGAISTGTTYTAHLVLDNANGIARVGIDGVDLDSKSFTPGREFSRPEVFPTLGAHAWDLVNEQIFNPFVGEIHNFAVYADALSEPEIRFAISDW